MARRWFPPGIPTVARDGRERRPAIIPAAAALLLTTLFAASGTSRPQLTTTERVSGTRWWPTKSAGSRAEYVGPSGCAPCHESKVKSQTASAMARTAARAVDSDVLGSTRVLGFTEGAYRHEIHPANGMRIYTVSDGSRAVSAALEWAFGVGRVGQTFLFEREGVMHEARGSYFGSLNGLHFTPGRALDMPRHVDAALARPLTSHEARRCFACHTTASSFDGRLSAAELIPGVTCEACHGPGRAHVEAMRQHDDAKGLAAIVNPASLSPVDAVDFCGACHATFWDVTLAGQKGIAALRSQPFRLQSSRCWGEGDRRITCQVCHDSHQPLDRDADVYDRRCLSCHRVAASVAGPTARSDASATAPPCKARGRERCSTCHMPKYRVPEMHSAFTDHLIRVVRAD